MSDQSKYEDASDGTTSPEDSAVDVTDEPATASRNPYRNRHSESRSDSSSGRFYEIYGQTPSSSFDQRRLNPTGGLGLYTPARVSPERTGSNRDLNRPPGEGADVDSGRPPFRTPSPRSGHARYPSASTESARQNGRAASDVGRTPWQPANPLNSQFQSPQPSGYNAFPMSSPHQTSGRAMHNTGQPYMNYGPPTHPTPGHPYGPNHGGGYAMYPGEAPWGFNNHHAPHGVWGGPAGPAQGAGFGFQGAVTAQHPHYYIPPNPANGGGSSGFFNGASNVTVNGGTMTDQSRGVWHHHHGTSGSD